jgi:hypothetical protein
MTRENKYSIQKMNCMSRFVKISCLILVAFCSGCFKHEIKDYIFRRRMVCAKCLAHISKKTKNRGLH